ncbi:chaperonin GroEL [Candidatus Gracilibacteria bacterium 28_42_T64]|nr:chaperonin GroEL [Candidatus Gracilibacteria bacterium 28_42_T64]
MSKEIKYSDDARSMIFKGIEVVAKTVTVTMGPKGRNVILEKAYGAPQVTNDGVTIAREIELEDKYESLGAELVKEAAEKTNTIAGDGTTTATLLTYALAKEGLRYIKSGVNAVELKNGMKKAVQLVSDELAKNSKAISSKEEIAQVASISAQDPVVGEIIAEAMDKVGNDGIISVEEGQTFGLEVEITEGMEFDQGYLSPYMVSNPEKMLSEIKDASILITDGKISNMQDLLPLLESLVQSGKKDLVIIAEDIEGEVLTTIILNKLKGILNVLAIKAPGFGDTKKEMIKDIAILTGANVIASDLGMKVSEVSLDDLGSAKNVMASKDATTIIAGSGHKSDIESRVSELKLAIENSDSTFNKDKLAERIAKLAGGVAMIKVGAASEVEMKEKKLRIEDALNATRAAVSEGVVAGGGVALLTASKILKGVDFGNEDQTLGASIVKQALSYPMKQIAENSGKEGSVIMSKIEESDNIFFGYDAAGDKYVDMIVAGILDPKKVARVALEEAVSLAGMFLTTEAAITSLPKSESDLPMGGMGAGMPGMGGMPMM